MEAIGLAEGEEKVLIASCHQNLAAVYDELVRKLTPVRVCLCGICFYQVKKDTDPEQKVKFTKGRTLQYMLHWYYMYTHGLCSNNFIMYIHN